MRCDLTPIELPTVDMLTLLSYLPLKAGIICKTQNGVSERLRRIYIGQQKGLLILGQ